MKFKPAFFASVILSLALAIFSRFGISAYAQLFVFTFEQIEAAWIVGAGMFAIAKSVQSAPLCYRLGMLLGIRYEWLVFSALTATAIDIAVTLTAWSWVEDGSIKLLNIIVSIGSIGWAGLVRLLVLQWLPDRPLVVPPFVRVIKPEQGSNQSQPTNLNPFASPQNVARTVADRATIYVPESKKPWSIETMVSEIDNRLILGLKGSGKTVVVSEMIRIVRSRYPDKRVFAIDPKADPKEVDLYSLATEVHRGNIGEMTPAEALKFIEEGYEKYINHPEPGLLIIDECIMVGGTMTDNKSSYLESKLRYIVAGGDSRNLNVWLIAQSPMLKDLGLTTGVATQLNKTIIATAESLPNIRAWGNGVLMTGIVIDDALIAIKVSPIPKGRAIYNCGWHPMPIITTQFNRDERRVNPSDVPTHDLKTPQNIDPAHDLSDARRRNAGFDAVPTHDPTDSDARSDVLTEAILAYFAALPTHEPRPIEMIRGSRRMTNIKAGTVEIQAILDKLLQSMDLILTDGGYLSRLWQSEDDRGNSV
jgi:hypothetical protein